MGRDVNGFTLGLFDRLYNLWASQSITYSGKRLMI
jgi:hypothetical protein